MKVVKVYGELRKRLGQCRFEFDVATPAQAVKALCVNFPGLDKWLVDSEQDGIGYRVKIGKEQVTSKSLDLLAMPWSEREVFSITPVVAGAGGGSGFGSILVGALFIGASFFFPGAGLFGVQAIGATGAAGLAGTGIATSIGVGLSAIGAGMVIGGVADIISPMAPPGLEASKEAAKMQNMSFSGVVNTARQGLPVPIAYGRVFVGSAVISSGFDVDHSPNSAPLDPIDLFLQNKAG